MSYPVGPPTEAGYLNFLRNFVGISTNDLPDDSPAIDESFCTALPIVNPFLRCVPGNEFNRAVYNLATDYLFNIAQNNSAGSPPSTYFTDARKKWNILGFVSGVVNTANDQGTGDGLVVPDQMSNLTLADLQNLKTPWGRAYLAIAQNWGSDLYGIS